MNPFYYGKSGKESFLRKKTMKKSLLLPVAFLALIFLFFIQPAFSQSAPEITSLPDWVRNDWDFRTQKTGVWIADNTAYKSSDEPYKAYGLKWTYGNGKNYLHGELFGILDNEEKQPFWEFLEFWDPAAKELRVVQLGGNGTVGEGKITREEDGRLREQQTFTTRKGTQFQTGHLLWTSQDVQHTESYIIRNGEWVKNRYFQWKLKKE